ncbi:vWA domain-containing protein [Hydrogenimonas sp.]
MRFLYPEYIYLMLIPAAFLMYLISTNKDALERVFDFDTLQRLRISGDALGKKGHNTLLFITFFFMILALAEPVIDKGSVHVKSGGSDIVISIDFSKSMQAKDFYPDRFDFARQKSRELIRALNGERIGLIAFTSASFIISPLTYDTKALLFLLDKMDPSYVTAEGTDLSSALKGAAKLLRKSHDKTLVLVTDGGDSKNMESLVRIAKKENIKIIVWMVATKQGAPVPGIKKERKPVISRANLALSRLAEESKGAFVWATLSQKDEKEIERFIESHSVKIKKRVVERRIELFYLPLAIALMILPFALYSIGPVKRDIAIFLLFFLIPVQNVRAGLLDFELIEKAQKAYREGDCKKSIEAFEKLAVKSAHNEAWYDLGNSYYKCGRYKMALQAYEHMITSDTKKRMHKLYNMANCHVKLGNLQRATELYKKVLELGDDSDARFNLALVENALKAKQKDGPKSANKKNGQSKNTKQGGGVSKESQAKQGVSQKGKKAPRSRELTLSEEKKWMRLIENQPLKAKLYPLTPSKEKKDTSVW